jgi:putative transposase
MQSVLMEQPDFLVPVVPAAVEAILEVAMAECLQAGKHERNDPRLGYRSGYYRRRLITRVGTRVLGVPQDRAGHFSTQVFEQYQRREQALVAALAQLYVPGVSTRRVAAIREELCGHEFSASSLSAITARLDAPLEEFSRRPLSEAFPYVILDARSERVREGGGIVSRAILVAVAMRLISVLRFSFSKSSLVATRMFAPG